GDNVTIRWNDTNIGTGAAGGAFSDSVNVYHVNTDGSLTLLTSGTVAGQANLAAGASAAQTFSLRLPDGSAGAGTIRFVVTTDTGHTLLEYDAVGNPAFANNTSTLDQTSALLPYPDLDVSNVQAPALTIADPATVTVSWTVTNHGLGAGRVGTWEDWVIVTTNNDLNGTGNVVLGKFTHTGGLAAGDSYTQTQQI